MEARGSQSWRIIAGLFAFTVFVCMLTGRVMAQTTTGSIYGTVADTSGAVIPNVTVTVTEIQTGESHTVSSNQSGNYVFPALAPGNYTVSAQVVGFQAETQRNITLDANQNLNASFSLRAGATSQTVTVNAATTMVDTRESALGETVDQKRVQDLPLNGRNVYSLVTLVPGVTNYSAEAAIGDDTGAVFSTNGVRPTFNSFYLDGGYDTNLFRSGGNLVPNPDALAEFRLQTSNYDAEFGRLPGGVVNIITSSGTNAYHGLLYDYLRNNVLNAKNYFITGVTPLKQNQFGGNLGGPIIHQKAFFFVDYEGLRIDTPIMIASSAIITPTPLEATGNFSASATKPKLPAGTNCGSSAAPVICPTALDPVAMNALKFVPLGNPTPGANLGHPAQQSTPGTQSANQGLTRVDYQLTSKHKLSGLFFISRGSSLNYTGNGAKILDFDGVVDNESQTNLVASDTWVISPAKLNSLRLFYTETHSVNATLFHNTLGTLGSNASQGAPLANQPDFSISGYWQMGGNRPNNIAQQTFGASDTFNWTRGNHALKLGGSFLWSKYSETAAVVGGGVVTFTGAATGNALADFLLGKANTFRQNSGSHHRTHAPDPALFAQDDWRIAPRLTLNLGLRWEVFPPLAGQNDVGTFDPYVQSKRFPTAPLGLLSAGDPGVPDGILHTSYKDFAPRVGFAYDVFGNGNTSLRGAYGIFYAANQETFEGNLVQQPFLLDITVNQTPNLVSPYVLLADPFPYTVDLQNPDFVANASVYGLGSQHGIPYVQEYNLTVQQQLATNWGAQLGYVGNVTRKFYLLRDANSPVYSPGASVTTVGLNARRPYQPTPKTYTFAAIGVLDPSANSSYNALQATITRRFAHQFSLQASYVWSKTIDIVSADPGGFTAFTLADENDPAMDRGLSTIHLPQSFVASYLWAAPAVRRWGFVGRQVLSGWQLNGITTLQTGNPFNVLSNKDTNLDGDSTDRPNLVGDPNLPGHRSRAQKIAKYFNTAAFAQITAPNVPYGTSPRDPVVGPGYVNTDFSAFKTFPIWRESTLQFRGEIYNIFDNVNLNNPNGTLTAAQFGQVTASGSPRIVQFALRYMF